MLDSLVAIMFGISFIIFVSGIILIIFAAKVLVDRESDDDK